jgi:hypothetical protein
VSQEAELWLSSVDRKFDDGPGTPALCVKFAACEHCGAKPGELCHSTATNKLTIGHHWRRAREYLGLKRAGKAPGPSNTAATRLKNLEARVAELEKLTANKTPASPRSR